MPRSVPQSFPHRIQVYFTAEEFAAIQELSRSTGASLSTVVRMMTRTGIEAGKKKGK